MNIVHMLIVYQKVFCKLFKKKKKTKKKITFGYGYVQ